MGYIYKVAIKNAKWPSLKALDESLRGRSERVRIPIPTGNPNRPFATAANESLTVLLDGRPHTVNARDYEFDPANDDFELAEIMASAKMDVSKIHGAHIFSITAHADDRDWLCVSSIMRSLIGDFGGYGMNFQTGAAGEGEWLEEFNKQLEKDKLEYREIVDRIVREDESSIGATEDRRGLFARCKKVFCIRGSPSRKKRVLERHGNDFRS